MKFQYLSRMNGERKVFDARGPFSYGLEEWVRQGFSGNWLDPFKFLTLYRGPAAVLFARIPSQFTDSGEDEFLVMENFRPATIHVGTNGYLLECLAGMMEPGEDPLVAIRREFGEETRGIEIIEGTLKLVFSGFTTPGICDEELFCAVADIRIIDHNAAKIAGLEYEGEDTRRHSVTKSQLFKMLADGSLRDMKMQAMANYYFRHEAESKLSRIPWWIRRLFGAA